MRWIYVAQILMLVVVGLLGVQILGCAAEEESVEQVFVVEKQAEAEPIDTILTPWVDRLNMRSAPSSAAKVVAKINQGDRLRFTGEVSDNFEAIVLRGGLYEQPWFEVITADSVRGWVFAGACGPIDQTNVAPLQKDKLIHFDKLGKFDLSQWSKGQTIKTDHSDINSYTTLYRQGGNKLELREFESDESYYGNEQKLYANEDKLLRSRTFKWTNNTDNSALEETVVDYTGDMPIRYSRKQATKISYTTLSDRPTRAVGAWKITKGSAAQMPDAATRLEVTGVWQSVDDPRASLKITAQNFQYWYDGKLIGTPQLYKRMDRCPEEAGGYSEAPSELGAYFVLDDEEEQRCLHLNAVTDTQLEFSNVGRGNTLRYTRS